MKDIGLRLADSLYKELMVDEQWAVRRERGFTWWSYRLAQHIEVGPKVRSFGHDVCSVRIWTEVVRDVHPASDPARVLGALNMQAILNALVWDSAAGTINNHCTATVHKQNFKWITKVLATAAVLQNAAAHSRAHGLAEVCGGVAAATDHPTSGQRPEKDDLLNVPERLIVPEGARPSRFVGPRMKQVEKFLARMGFVGFAELTGLTCEVPFTGATPAIVLVAEGRPASQRETSLVQIFTDAPHPKAGNGALLVMRLPFSADSDRVALQANELNFAEALGDKETMLMGAWCPDPNSDARLAYCSFVPNALSRWVIAENLISQQANRSRFAAEVLVGS
jgi:hypothetical protein